ncbi:TonB-dependent receptor plug domain-containing protein [Nostoc sp.]|uniref:TonB-dependent receptor plug domain-containing protein n=1 Tax=Nostoc sp. TaxID=1180 RepID=UPI002FFC4EB5
MKLEQFLQSLLLTGSVVVLVITPVKSEEVRGINQRLRISEVNLPPKSIQRLVQSPTPNAQPANVVEITAIKVNPTDKAVEVILETPKGTQLQVLPKSEGNSYIVDIPNAQLLLPSENTFCQDNPVVGITAVTVTNQDATTIRMMVVGGAGIPTVEIFDSQEGLIFGFTSTVSSTQQPQTPQTPQVPTANQPEKPSSATDKPIEIVVTGEEDGYRIPNATTATGTDTPLQNIPQAIQVIPQQVLKDQQVTNLDEAVRNVSGVVADSFEGRGYRFNIRGFAGAPVLRDGFRPFGLSGNQDSQGQSFAEIANINCIEVLKEPASILFGQIEPGGAVNVITKKPLEQPFYETEFQVGSGGLVRPQIDVSGPLTSDKSVLYRLNALYLHDDTFRNFDTDIQRFFVAPALTWKIGDPFTVIGSISITF